MNILNPQCSSLILAAVVCVTYSLASAEPPSAEKRITHNDASLVYTEVGEGDTVVAIHGAVSDKRVWDGYQQPISEHYHFVTYTRRFYGIEPWPEGQNVYNATVHADDLVNLIRSLGSAPVHLLARSSGGYTAVIAAVKHPELIRSLVLWEPYVGNDFIPSAGFDEKSLGKVSGWRKGFGPAVKAANSGDTKTAIKHFIEHVYELGSGGFSAIPEELKHMFYDNARTLPLLYSGETTDKVTCDFLGKIKVPTLVVRGGKTAEGYALTHVKAAECIPGSKLLVIDGVVHDGASKKIAELSNLAFDFWDKLK